MDKYYKEPTCGALSVNALHRRPRIIRIISLIAQDFSMIDRCQLSILFNGMAEFICMVKGLCKQVCLIINYSVLLLCAGCCCSVAICLFLLAETEVIILQYLWSKLCRGR